ncbi:DUF5906 domain-containing protein [Microvirga lenta]|uniref:DUF5906 domain-containing protein n=1 Tax=Microvirga lenta TaxID=2881337 RepID=UPI001CFF70ED|nr:DUF5906 domain-containing protein [Microvirga lenta]MCB5175543.1 DUF5906 domain-containing protein [Microvirga lenta]
MSRSSLKIKSNTETEINQAGNDASVVVKLEKVSDASQQIATTVNYRSIPALALYIDRIGAEQLNFKRFVVREYDGRYHTERALITLAWKNGQLEVTCSNDDYKPTEPELAAIRTAMTADTFPKSVPATQAQYESILLGKKIPKDADTYPAYDKSGKMVLMVQQRIETESGKAYVPWTFWDDGEWRNMEPDGELPLFGLDRLRGNPRWIMLHEGAKAGDRLNWMFNENSREAWEARAAHPWASDLENLAHVGWIGGALNPHRTDWSPLPSDAIVIMVCDNDKPGMDAAPKISKLIKRSMRAVVFNDDFPEAFDLADEFPKEMFKTVAGETIYTGPSMRDLEIDATWATYQVINPSTNRPAFGIRGEFSKDWYWTPSKLFVHRSNPGRIYSEDEFNAAVRPFSDVAKTADLLMRELSQRVDGLAYEPGEKTGVVRVDGERKFNTFKPSAIKPREKLKEGEADPFIEFMEHLIPNERDRIELLRWCATLVVHPEIHMTYAVLMISEEQGVGKTTLAEKILRPLIGAHNTSTPSASQMVNSAYNGWQAHKRLVICNEIYEGRSSKAYDKLKSVISDNNTRVEEKYKSSYDLSNFAHVFACSNSLRALKIEDGDRRWLIPRVTEETKPKEYWVKFNAWLNNGGLSIIYRWFIEFLKDHEPVSPADRAPDSASKQAVIAATKTEGQQLAADLAFCLIERFKATGERILTTTHEVRTFIGGRLNRSNDPRLESPETIARELKMAGMSRGDKPMRVFGEKRKLVANFDISGREFNGDLEKEGIFKDANALADIFKEAM